MLQSFSDKRKHPLTIIGELLKDGYSIKTENDKFVIRYKNNIYYQTDKNSDIQIQGTFKMCFSLIP